ncbi:hypothetical protein BDD12DRAFT_807897 [Trichophaea hybrida]|nr:hypothetical protein BDD12DRAFT_807897 [Trichophaea hybrida]
MKLWRITTIRRLQAFTFCSGFAIVTASGTAKRKRFKCVHHQENPRNTRKLEDIPVSHQEYHEAGGISLTMNQNTYYNLGVRKDPTTGDDSPEAIIDCLGDLLKSKAYHYRTRWEHVQIDTQLTTVWFKYTLTMTE